MDHSIHNRMLRLISLLESLLASTRQAKIEIVAHSSEAQALLHGWVLSEHEITPDASLSCQCLELKKQQLNTFLEKVEKAVKYSQCIREGRSDVTSPWRDEAENDTHEAEGNKLNSLKGGRILKISSVHTREKMGKLKNAKVPSKRCSGGGISENVLKPNVSLPEQQESSNLCPLHGQSQSDKLKKVQTVDLAEALDVKGIPPELVTVLKAVHHYINRSRTTTSKNRAETSFERHLNALNEARWDKFSAFSSLFKTLSNSQCFQETRSPEVSSVSEPSISLCSIWNPAINNVISAGTLCVEYQNEDMWHSLQLRLQQLQLSQVEWQLCDILSFDPLLSNSDLQYSTVSLFFKAASALSQLANLNWPVLVKTCQDS